MTFYSLNRNTQEINTIKTAFQNYYDQKESRLANNAVASIKGLNPIAGAQVPPKDPPVREKDIPEVVINVPAVPERDIDPWWYKGPGGINYGTNPGGGMSGGSDVHGGGGSGTPSTEQEQDPCAKNKSITDSKTFKDNSTVLNGKTSDSSEFGYRMDLPIPNGRENQFLTSKIGSQQVDLTAFPNTYGLMHSHYDGLYPMFSPGDIVLFNRWVNYVYNNNQITNPGTPIPKLSDIFFTVNTSQGTYMLKFDPSVRPTKFPEYSQKEFDKLNRDYKTALDQNTTVANVSGNVTYDMEGIEKSFLNFVLDKMNMPGLKLIRVDEKGNKEWNSQSGSFKETKCKQ
ncbi:hypothetical protein HZQ11_06235 [Elizabethkingia anophelis]|uniref:hypothetical protein n=1 Tax=Elizabethkingia TaxID=308865 RepID=UPI00073987A2|nr:MULTISPECIES: hypothetical protein [Elizabethkingia]KUF42726.1 hypothetical protein AS358_04445 [Elizabethkingia anophelis]MCT3644516.1 hypothetical protein [Elizabethkingia anophelis]MCT3651166.1 hypothetical protein [Elizabethkingia anophelis]MCT3654838.1 hypothetical protein [Elizabethkingia anophelis]MCT3658233.1 hypothetical protein [Elizabethkingia anophelis]